MADRQNTQGHVQPWAIIPIVICALLCLFPLVLWEKESSDLLSAFFNWYKIRFGSLYLVLAVVSLGVCLWLAFGRFGNIRLGEPDEKPQFTTPTWAAMLFCTGVAGGVLYWSIADPIFFTHFPPFYAEPLSKDAFLWASTYTYFHWGPVPWSFYIICSIPIGYSFYVRKKRFMRVSTSCLDIFPDKFKKPVSRLFDVLFAVGLLIANISIAGFTIPMVSEAFSNVSGIQHTYTLEFSMLVLTAAIYCTSSFLGLEKGIARLSRFNIYVAIVMIIYVFTMGPTSFLVDNFINGVGNMFQNIIRMSTWTDPHTDGTFPQDWTMFYWAYWLTYAPLTGLFVASISRGRTIRQIIVQGLSFGIIGAWCIHAVFGGYSIHVALHGIQDISTIFQQHGIFPAIVAVLNTLPLKNMVLVGFCVFSIIFFATSLDSSAFSIAIACTDDLGESGRPSRWHTLAWAVVMAIIPAGLLKVGGLEALKAVVNVSAIPITIISIFMVAGFFKSIFEDEKHGLLNKRPTKK